MPNFQRHYSSFQFHAILQKSCWYGAQKACLIIINIKNSYAASCFCGKFGVRKSERKKLILLFSINLIKSGSKDLKHVTNVPAICKIKGYFEF